MTTLNHSEFDDTDNTSDSLRAEEHDYVVTVNDSGFLGADDSLGDGPVDENGFADYDDTQEEKPAEEPAIFPVVNSPLPAVETSADLTEEDEVAPGQPVPEALGEHREGESITEWLRNDWEQTKQDLRLGGS